MELINPDGSVRTIPPAEAAPAAGSAPTAEDMKGAASIKPPEPVKSALWGGITTEGVMLLEINMAVVSERPELMDQFSGFMDRFKAVGLAKMVNQQQRRAEIKAVVQKQQARDGFRGLMNKIRGGR